MERFANATYFYLGGLGLTLTASGNKHLTNRGKSSAAIFLHTNRHDFAPEGNSRDRIARVIIGVYRANMEYLVGSTAVSRGDWDAYLGRQDYRKKTP